MVDRFQIPRLSETYSISFRSGVPYLSSNDLRKKNGFMYLEADKFLSPIELLAELADKINPLDTLFRENGHAIYEEEWLFMAALITDTQECLGILIIIVDGIPCSRQFKATFNKLAFAIEDHLENTEVLFQAGPDWWIDLRLDHQDLYQRFMGNKSADNRRLCPIES